MEEFQRALAEYLFISGIGLAWLPWSPHWALEIHTTNVSAGLRRDKGGVSASSVSEEEFQRANA